MAGKENTESSGRIQHVFIIGAKSLGQYGGYETFVDRLIREHENEESIKYHVACKANGNGFMDESKLSDIKVLKRDKNGFVLEFEYKKSHVFKIQCPNIGPGVAIYYDRAALLYSIKYCKKHKIQSPIFYILTCRIGLFIGSLTKTIKSIGGKYYLNPDGHEWKRSKWSKPVRLYWKWSEKRMINQSDLVICDSMNIEKYVKEEYGQYNTKYISYGADVDVSILDDKDPKFTNWLKSKSLKAGEYYLVVGRFVPENNYETVIKEFMASNSKKKLALITNANDKFMKKLENKLHFRQDKRINFVGTVYDKELLKKIREKAYAYIHGHEVGGTNPSLLESLASTSLNLLLNVNFNKEVAGDSAMYWKKDSGNLAELINEVDGYDSKLCSEYGLKAKNRINIAFSWKFVGNEYKEIWKL